MQIDALPGGLAQPFYRVLVDIRDRPRLGPPQGTYVAQVRCPKGVVPKTIHHMYQMSEVVYYMTLQCNLELLRLTPGEAAMIQHSNLARKRGPTRMSRHTLWCNLKLLRLALGG